MQDKQLCLGEQAYLPKNIVCINHQKCFLVWNFSTIRSSNRSLQSTQFWVLAQTHKRTLQLLYWNALGVDAVRIIVENNSGRPDLPLPSMVCLYNRKILNKTLVKWDMFLYKCNTFDLWGIDVHLFFYFCKKFWKIRFVLKYKNI